MEDRDREMITRTATNVDWLVEAHKENSQKRQVLNTRVDSLEKSRARAKGAGIVAGGAISLSGLFYKIFGG